ncbi:MAG: GGDEF domain-containing protein [Ruminococcus sp.]|jgi:diguanylate cyclase (GGDEF)-like protein|nr:GGDEF domain-containing protein [Ruminococcus sp.]
MPFIASFLKEVFRNTHITYFERNRCFRTLSLLQPALTDNCSQLNIMNDYSFPDESCYVIGEAVIDSSLHTQRADEEFFSYFGNDVIYSIQRTIHDDDFPRLKVLLDNIAPFEIRKIALRMKGINSEFRWMCVSVSLCNSKEPNYRLRITDILSLEQLFYSCQYKISEFHQILSMIEELSFEYSFETERIKISMFDCFRTITLTDEPLPLWQQKAVSSGWIPPRFTETFDKLCSDIKNGTYKFEYELESALLTAGKSHELNLFKGVTRYDDLEHKKVIGIISVISSKYKSKETSSSVDNSYDSLSGLLSKRAITENAMRIIAAAPHYNVNFVLLDIDNFTRLNADYGHLFGDEVLFTVANIIKSAIGTRGIAGRISGGGFMIVIEETVDETDLRSILRAIRTKIDWAFSNRFENLILTCSMGISTYPVDSKIYDELFMQADKALFIAQEKGKNRYVIYDVSKHGAVEMDTQNKIAYLNYKKSVSNHINFIGTITDRLVSGNLPELSQLLDEIRIQFALDSAYIFHGAAMKPIVSCGNSSDIDAMYIFSDSYNEKFSGDGVLAVDNINELEGRADEAFTAFTSQNIMGTFQYLITDKSKIIALISFNYINRFKKWSETDVNYLTILCRIIAAVL